MKRWFTSDIHLGHRNVIEYCARPYANVHEMDKAIIEQWNSQVNPEDEVYFLGDFGINKRKALDKELVNSLNGVKYITLGNHDSGFVRWHNKKNIESIVNGYIKSGWDGCGIEDHLLLKNGVEVIMTHLPPDNSRDTRYSKFKLENDPNKIYLSGHLHGMYRKKDNMIDVAFDGELKLLSEDDIVNLIEDERSFIPTRLTEHYKEENLFLKPFEDEVKKKNLRKVVKGDLVLYNYTDKCTFDRAWNEVTIHSRGLILNRTTGAFVAVPFEKFWNINEMPVTQLENLPDEPYTVTDKCDGSLGIIHHHNNKWNVATRGAFSSPQAVKAEEILKKYDMSKVYTKLTLLVEIIYPENKIVANYGDDEKLVLLSMVDRESQQEQTRIQCGMISKCTGIELVKEYNHTIEEMIELKKTIPKDEEGFVVRFESGLRVKIKGDEYCRIHKMISRMSPLSFWESMDDGNVNIDYLQELPEEFRDEAEEITDKLESQYKDLLIETSEAFNEIKVKLGLCISESLTEDKKKLGLYIKKHQPKHATIFWAYYLMRPDNIDKYIKRIIRPKGNEYI
jgi:RNA ligase